MKGHPVDASPILHHTYLAKCDGELATSISGCETSFRWQMKITLGIPYYMFIVLMLTVAKG